MNQFSKKSIWVIDDQASIRLILSTFLSKSYRVKTLPDGLAGIHQLQKGESPDLILLDLNMPRLNGLGFLKQLRKSRAFSKLPVIIISSDNDSKTIEQCRHFGVKCFVPKPFDPTNLRSKIQQVVN